jgi:hypothetical protein
MHDVAGKMALAGIEFPSAVKGTFSKSGQTEQKRDACEQGKSGFHCCFLVRVMNYYPYRCKYRFGRSPGATSKS